MKSLEISMQGGSMLYMDADPGGEITKCQEQARNLAIFLRGNITLDHNGRKYVFDSKGGMVQLTKSQIM